MLSDVRVSSTAGGKAGRAKKDLRISPQVGALRIEVHRGERLGASWVRRQFIFNNLVGQAVPASRVLELVLTINRVYLANGYVNSGVLLADHLWPQTGGVLNLRLVSGRIVGGAGNPSGVTVTWAKARAGLTPAYVRARVPSARKSPLDGNALERDFRLLAQDPAIRIVNAQLEPGGPAGEATLSLSVDPQPRLDAYATFANNRSPSIGGDRGAVGASLRNTFLAGDLAGADVGITSGAVDGTISYSAPLTPSATVHARFTDDAAGVVTQVLKSLDIRSTDIAAELGVSQRLIDEPLTPIGETGAWSAAQTFVVGADFAIRDSTSSLLGQPFSFSPGEVNGRSHYGVARLTVDWVMRGERQVFAISGTTSFGLDGSGSDLPGVSQPDARFRTLLGQFNYARRVFDGSLEFHARASGQAASGLLYTGEQFAVGGAGTVRGFRENLLLADAGATGSIELSCAVRWGSAPCGKAIEDWRTVHVLTFLDGGYVHSATDQQPNPSAIASYGVSLAWSPVASIQSRITYGQPFRYVPPVGRPDLQDRGVSFELTIHPLNWLLRK